jgi:hypothetical protein
MVDAEKILGQLPSQTWEKYIFSIISYIVTMVVSKNITIVF